MCFCHSFGEITQIVTRCEINQGPNRNAFIIRGIHDVL